MSTPAIKELEQRGTRYVRHEYEHGEGGWGEEAAEKLGVSADQVFKTLVVACDGRLVVAVVPVSRQLSFKKLAASVGGKKAAMADAGDVMRSTGYVLGGVSPLGQKRKLPTVIDDSANGFPTIFVSAGRRGLEVELAAGDLANITGANLADISQP